AARLQRYPLSTFVKVGDTPADIDEGRNAGTWTVGVSETGNSGRDELERAGAHFVVDSVAEIGPTLDEIELRLSRHERPWRPPARAGTGGILRAVRPRRSRSSSSGTPATTSAAPISRSDCR